MTSAQICFILCILASAEAAGNWTDGWVCAFGSPCNNCVNNASWWSEESFTACGTQPSDMQNCTVVNTTETAIADNACKCGEAAQVCGIGHFCYDNTCNRVEKSGACTIDTVKPVPTDCTCAGSFIKNLIGTEADCTVGQYCYGEKCHAAAVSAAEQKKEEEGWSTTQWVLLGCGIAVGLGLLALVAAFMMGCFNSKKRGLKKSSKKTRAVKVFEEAQPLVAPQPTYVTYAAPPMTYIQQAPTYAAPTYAAPQAYAPQYMQGGPVPQYQAQPVATYAQPVAQYAYQQ